MSTIGFEHHDHHACIDVGVCAAKARCAKLGLRLTKVRERVLEILLQEHRAMGAYDVLDRLRDEGLGSQPPVAYRALDFLVTNGFAHRVERLNAFIACVHPGDAHAPAFLICKICTAVAETPSAPMRRQLDRISSGVGFQIDSTVIEAEGICPNCRSAQ